jgi:hypothetical protein
MTKRRFSVVLNTLILMLIPTVIFSSNLIINDTFPTNWDYSAHWDQGAGYWGSKWTIVPSGRNGTYCGQSQQPTNLISGSSMFAFTTPINAPGDKVFIRYWAKYPTNFDPRGGNHDPNGKALYGYNTQRWYAGPVGAATVAEYAAIPQNFSGTVYGTFYSYGDSVRYPKPFIIRDNQWHEYAWYIVQGTPGSANGTWACWVDGKGTYTQQNASAYYTNVRMQGLWETLVFGQYYKGGAIGNYTWWIDDIEVWDGLPSGTSTGGGSTVNNPPVAVVTSSVSGTVGSTVTLDGSKSYDPEGSTITYSWTQTGGTAVTLSSRTAARPTFVPAAAGTYTFTLRVSDGTNTSITASVTVTVQKKPVTASISLVSPSNGTTVSTAPTLKWSGTGITRYTVRGSINNGSTWYTLYTGTGTSCSLSSVWRSIKSRSTITWYVQGTTSTGATVKSSTGRFSKR